jgi:squalene-hopene/tetraprenyl-beta-curcumene cyclase
VRNEVRIAIKKGLTWLEKNQDTNGFWSTEDYPAITALALEAFELRPDRDPRAESAAVKKGYDYVMSCVQADGGIYRTELPSYNTSVSLVSVVLRHRPEDQAAILKAREFIIGLQNLSDDGQATNAPFVGGIGYGRADKHPDLSNTTLALEALYASAKLEKNSGVLASKDLNWPAVIGFIQRCQNLPDYNKESWASDDPQNKGGFIYSPGRSNAGQTNLPSGRVALRSYGSMSYAGLLSYIYAELKPDDPRVAAVTAWLRANYTLEENPALGPQGLFYYYHTLAKALTAYGGNALDTANGQTINWREQLALKLINLQKADGSWANDNGRWLEKDPALVTAYALIALDLICPKI